MKSNLQKKALWKSRRGLKELDLILLHKLNANTKMNIGYSQYATSEGLRAIRTNVGADSADWAYVQFQVNF